MQNINLEDEEIRFPVATFSDVRTEWNEACVRLLRALPVELREEVELRLRSLHRGGDGLRAWVSSNASRGEHLPDELPPELIEVYLSDPEAMPLDDCQNCGLAVPVRPNRLHGLEGDPEQRYFPQCPVCGGVTGPYLYWSRNARPLSTTEVIRRTKPR